DQRCKPARRNDPRVRSEFFNHSFQQTIDQRYVAVVKPRLNARRWICTDQLLGPANLGVAQPRGSLEQSVGRYLNPRTNDPAEVLARSRDYIKRSRRSKIHNDARRSILR